MVEGYIHGITTHSDQTLQEELDIKYGRTTRKAKREVMQRDTADLISLQEELGFNLVSDGQFLWPDIFRPVYSLLDGVQVGSQTRWFNTNGFTFTPLVTGPASFSNVDLTPFLYTDKLPEGKAGKITLPGPITLAHYTEGNDLDRENLVNLYARLLRDVSRDLVEKGYTQIEFAEPALLKDEVEGELLVARKETLQWAQQAYATITEELEATTIIQFFFGDPNNLTQEYIDLPVSGFLLDLVESPIRESTQLDFTGKILVAGALDSRSSIPEDLDFAAKLVSQAVERLGPEDVHVTTNGPLFYTIASEPSRNKIREVAKLAGLVKGVAS